ncbi:MAG: FtsW/RodA/SpoVE family cell cycle protein [Lachnospiraceae bacterium]|nr:FtsW/RodA/SpoVE family cell cycle protein [Lachnospiraceae bacterium]
MSVYVITLSKYILPVLLLIYAVSSLIAVLIDQEKRRSVPYGVMLCSASMTLLLAFLTLYYQKQDATYLFYYAFIQLGFFAFYMFFLIIYPRCCRLFLLNSCTLLTIGFLMLTRLNEEKAMRQFIITVISFAIMLCLPHLVDAYENAKRGETVYAALGLVLLLTVLLLGSFTNGSKLSFAVFGVTFQPSEFVKLLFVLFLASALRKRMTILRFCYVSMIAAAHVLVLTFSKDLGGALIFFVIYLFMMLLKFGKLWILPLGILGGAAAGGVAYRLFPHVQVRVQAFLDPWSVIDGQGYQITQSLFAIGRGGLFGLGLYEGNSARIPYVEQDFMFSAICEELGLLFAFALLLICLSTFLMALRLSLSLHDRFYRYSAFGFAVMYIFQVFLIVGGNVKFLLLTGVTLPLVSYGGSSVLSTLLLFGFLEGCYEIVGDRRRNVDLPERDGAEDENVRIYAVSAVLFVLLFLCMGIYTYDYIDTHAVELMSNSYNTGEEVLLTHNDRGMILSRDGEVLAQSDPETGERNYPYGKLFAHVVGYTGYGVTGLESLGNYYLLHSSISLAEQIENAKQDLKNPGDSLLTTLDVDVQQAALDAIGAYYGAIVVTDVTTGEVLAMVSTPDFDPNDPESVIAAAKETVSSASLDRNSVLVNRALNGLYPPGSTFKIVTAIEYLTEHPQDFSAYSFHCNGSVTIEGIKISCYHGSKHGDVDLYQSFAKSCNSSFANIASTLNWAQFELLTEKLYFGRSLPFELSTGISTVPGDAESDPEAKLQAGIGQGKTLMTPFHLNLLTCAIANDGSLVKPYLLAGVADHYGNAVETFSSPGKEDLIDPEIAAILQEMMQLVVEEGTATKLSGRAYSVAGKTGSAEYNTDGDSHAWFTGFAPVEDPKIAVTVILEGAGSGGDDAAPVARRVFDAYFDKYGM